MKTKKTLIYIILTTLLIIGIVLFLQKNTTNSVTDPNTLYSQTPTTTSELTGIKKFERDGKYIEDYGEYELIRDSMATDTPTVYYSKKYKVSMTIPCYECIHPVGYAEPQASGEYKTTYTGLYFYDKSNDIILGFSVCEGDVVYGTNDYDTTHLKIKDLDSSVYNGVKIYSIKGFDKLSQDMGTAFYEYDYVDFGGNVFLCAARNAIDKSRIENIKKTGADKIFDTILRSATIEGSH